MKTLIVKHNENWHLNLTLNGNVIKSYTFKRLVLAIERASELQLHVNNIDELPLTQYKNQSEV
jgi:hypothetical protein